MLGLSLFTGMVFEMMQYQQYGPKTKEQHYLDEQQKFNDIMNLWRMLHENSDSHSPVDRYEGQVVA